MKENLKFPVEANAKSPAMVLSSKTLKDRIQNWGTVRQLLPFFLQLSCCSYGLETLSQQKILKLGDTDVSWVSQGDPSESDILIVGGVISKKFSPFLREIYQKMLFPKWVVAVGACAATGGPFKSYAIEEGIGNLFPVDIIIPGCPVSDTNVREGLLLLQKKISVLQCQALKSEVVVAKGDI